MRQLTLRRTTLLLSVLTVVITPVCGAADAPQATSAATPSPLHGLRLFESAAQRADRRRLAEGSPLPELAIAPIAPAPAPGPTGTATVRGVGGVHRLVNGVPVELKQP